MTLNSIILVLFTVAICGLVFITKRKMSSSEQDKDKQSFAWWHYPLMAISAILVFDPFELRMELWGWLFFAITIGTNNKFKEKFNQ